MKKKKEERKINDLRPIILGQKDLSKYAENPPEWVKKKVERANEIVRKSGLPKEWEK